VIAKRVIARLAELVAALAFGASLGFAPEARALSPYLEIPDREEVVKTPAYRYANMTNDEAYAELDRRGILYTREKPIAGVRAPIRLTGRLHGVLVRSVLPPAERATTAFEILDARLALALDDFSEILVQHDVVEVVHYTMYRPNVAKPDDVDDDGEGAHPVKGHARAGTHAAHHEPKRGHHEPKRASHPAKTHAPSKDDKAAKPSKRAPEPRTSGKKKKSAGAEAGAKGLAGLDGASEVDLPRESFDLTSAGELGAKAARSKKKRSAVRGPAHGKSGNATTREKAAHDKGGAHDKGAKANAKKKASPEKKFVKPPPKWAPPGTRHPAGLAIDVGILKKKDGSQLSIAADFDGNIGDQTCGAGAPSPSRPAARELREIVCQARAQGIFTYALTPNFDVAHRDHFHMEIKPGVYWFLYN
jgi:hypothetical protein